MEAKKEATYEHLKKVGPLAAILKTFEPNDWVEISDVSIDAWDKNIIYDNVDDDISSFLHLTHTEEQELKIGKEMMKIKVMWGVLDMYNDDNYTNPDDYIKEIETKWEAAIEFKQNCGAD